MILKTKVIDSEMTKGLYCHGYMIYVRDNQFGVSSPRITDLLYMIVMPYPSFTSNISLRIQRHI